MITRQNEVNGFLITETRKRSHWIVFDVLGVLMNFLGNSWLNSPRLFALVYEQYIKFTQYSRKYSELTVKKIEVKGEHTEDYSQLIADVLLKTESTEQKILN